MVSFHWLLETLAYWYEMVWNAKNSGPSLFSKSRLFGFTTILMIMKLLSEEGLGTKTDIIRFSPDPNAKLHLQ